MGVFERLLHVGEGRKLKALESLVPEVGAFEPDMERRTDEELRALTGELRERIDRAGDPVTDRDRRLDALDDVLPEAFAVVREAAPPHARPAPLRRPADRRRWCSIAARSPR